MASDADQGRPGAAGLLAGALVQLTDRRWLPVALLFLVFLGGTNTLLALSKPEAGAKPGLAFAAAGLIRVLALVSISVAALRIATDSPRRRWMPDGGLWLYFVLSLTSLAGAALGALLGARLGTAGRIILTELAGIVLVAPIAVWSVAAATERPLASSPAPRLRRLRAWLPAYLLWSILLVVPLACLHAYLSLRLIETVGRAVFWPLAAVDAVASTLLVLLGLALRVAAYRRVAPR